MNIVFKTKFKDYGNGDKHVHIPAIIVSEMKLKHGEVLNIDCIDDVITIKRENQGQKK